MKTIQLLPILFLLFVGCKKEKAKIDEVPSKVFILTRSDNIADTLTALLPENQNIKLSNPVLFSDTIQKNIVLTQESEVYVSFINEGAGYQNSLCWYSYNKSNPPLKVSDIKGNVLFPNISKIGEGGKLEQGYTLQLGTEKFPAGTVIGFFLVVNGWQDGTINYSGPIYYTDYSFNLGGTQQHILFKKIDCGEIVIGFEDISVTYVTGTTNPANQICDNDYNDILFSVTDNKEGYEATSFDLSKVAVK